MSHPPACSNAFEYENPVCLNNGTIHIGDRTDSLDMSCSYCDCPEGWGGLDCGRCMELSVCPQKEIDGVVSPGRAPGASGRGELVVGW